MYVFFFEDCQQQPVKLLLFGECLKEHWKVQIGTAIALTSPTFMDGDSQNKGDGYNCFFSGNISQIKETPTSAYSADL